MFDRNKLQAIGNPQHNRLNKTGWYVYIIPRNWGLDTWKFSATKIVYAAQNPICDMTMDPRIRYRSQGPYKAPPISKVTWVIGSRQNRGYTHRRSYRKQQTSSSRGGGRSIGISQQWRRMLQPRRQGHHCRIWKGGSAKKQRDACHPVAHALPRNKIPVPMNPLSI